MSGPSLQQLLSTYSYTPANPYTARVLQQIRQCRTHACGYHLYDCDNEDCSTPRQYRYNSCRNRHCPRCGHLQKEEWIEKRISELLPAKYFHVVFTLPHEFNGLVMGNRRKLYKLLMDSSWYTLQQFGRDEQHLGAEPGVISILHTWGQQLSFHPHVHCIVSGGGITCDHQWKEAKKVKYDFLFPVDSMMQVYRGRFLKQLRQLKSTGQLKCTPQTDATWNNLMIQMSLKDWVVYAKQPFGGPSQVVEYLGRYTHKVAISNNRIKEISSGGEVTFSYKDYSDGNKQKEMGLPALEFIRRFEQHILPKGFTKIRHYGYLGNRGRSTRIQATLAELKLPPPKPVISYDYATGMLVRYGINVDQCKCCGTGRLSLIMTVKPVRKEKERPSHIKKE